MTVQRARSAYTDNITHISAEADGQSPVQPLLRAPGALLATAAQSQREVLSFMAMRLEKDSDAVREAAACQSWSDALNLQRRWLQEMMGDYTAETTRMLTLYARAGQPEGEQRSA